MSVVDRPHTVLPCLLGQVKQGLPWTNAQHSRRMDSLCAALLEPDDDNAKAKLKKAAHVGKAAGQAVLSEMKQLNRLLGVGIGTDLAYFVPTYFAEKVYRLSPSCNSWAHQLAPWDERPLLRIVGDREKSQNAMQSFLCSRLRAMELSDPHHILWRVAQLGIEHAGFKDLVAALTVTANAWKGPRTQLHCFVVSAM